MRNKHALCRLLKIVFFSFVALSFFGVDSQHGPSFAQANNTSSDIVVAQNQQRGFNPFAPFRRLFGGGNRKKAEPSKPKAPSRPAGDPPKFEAKPKDPNAGVILVVGDRMARGVADGLVFLLADKPQIRVEKLIEDKAQFTDSEDNDWSADVLSKLRRGDVKAVVVMIGREDLGKTFPGDPPKEFMTDEWLSAYRSEVAALVRVVRQEKKPLVWIGLPPTRDNLVAADFTQLNSIFEAAAEDRRVRYLDIWDILLGEDGGYASFGPDVDGKNARLRTRDNIGFTWAGFQKVAFFVDRELLRLLGSYGGFAFEGVEDDPNFIVLTGRTTSPETLLLGGEEERELDPKSRTYRFFINGEPLQPMRGRVDDPRVGFNQ